MKIIARYEGPLSQKFGVPRQAGIVEEIPGRIIFEPDYRDKQAFRGLEEFSHLWLIWVFSENKIQDKFKPTIRPPRLKGVKRIGVWASRSPNRPNPIGLSAVKIESIDWDNELGPVISVSGADLVDGTPILDIKPYIVYADSIEGAKSGFAQEKPSEKLDITWGIESPFSVNDTAVLENILKQDPRPAYQDDANRVYGMEFMDKNIKFNVVDSKLTILEVEELIHE